MSPQDKNSIKRFADHYCIKMSDAKKIWIEANGNYPKAFEILLTLSKEGKVTFTK